MARTPAQRGKVGNWLVESRLARGWDTQEKARAEIHRLTGWTIPQSVYAEWESGRRLPADANLDRLISFYGDAPEATQSGEAVAQALLVQAAALDRHTQAISELVSRLESLAGDAIREGVADALREAEQGRAGGGSPDERPPAQFA